MLSSVYCDHTVHGRDPHRCILWFSASSSSIILRAAASPASVPIGLECSVSLMVLRPALMDSVAMALASPQQHSISAVKFPRGCEATWPREAEEEEAGVGADATPNALACAFLARRSWGECCEPVGCSKACWAMGSGRPSGVGGQLTAFEAQ